MDAAAYAVPDLLSPFHEPNTLADVLPSEPCTDDSDPEPVAFYRAHATHKRYHADGPAEANHAHIGANLAAAHGLPQVQLCLMLRCA